MGVNHIVPCRDLTGPSHFGRALRDISLALQRLKHENLRKQLEDMKRCDPTSRSAPPFESVPAQPVTPPAQSGLDVLHEKIGEVLVCAGMVPSGSFMVMKNMDSGGYVRVTLEDVQQWPTFFKHVVTNFLLPLAELNLVHDDLHPDCGNLWCTKNFDDTEKGEVVTNVCVLDLDSLRPFDNGMFNGMDGRYPMSQTCLDKYSFVAQTLIIAFCAAETVPWQSIL